MNTFQNERQHVIPRWLTYNDAVNSGELDKPRKSALANVNSDASFDEEFEVFEKSGAILLASDLMGRAMVRGDGERAAILAKRVLENGASPAVTLQVARSILGVLRQPNVLAGHHERAAELKRRLRDYPANPMCWIELARIYTILNQDRKAKAAIRTALALAPNDRFCVRAAARFYIHIHDKEEAYKLFRGHSQRLKDPWMQATGASTAIWAGKPSMLPKKSQLAQLLAVRKVDYSELIEAYAMEEFYNGGDRLAKKAVRAALAAPSANAVSHAEWFTRTCLPGIRDAIKPHASISRAAQAHELFFQEGDVNRALAVSEEWILEEPYSSAPLVHASYLASVAGDYKKVVSIVEEAAERRIANVTLLNNAAFSLVHLGRLSEARELLDAIMSKQGDHIHFSVLATDGLCKIKAGLVEEGKLAYDLAIEAAISKESQAVVRVKLHKFLALLENGQQISDDDWESFREIEKNPRDTAERILISDVAQLRDTQDFRGPEPRCANH